MKPAKWILLSVLVVSGACSKYLDYNGKGWTKEEEAYYTRVISLQTEAGAKFESLSKTVDSLEAIRQVQQFFQADTMVTSATISSQGISVQYSNGMRGGIFLNPRDNPGSQQPALKPMQKAAESGQGTTSLVNNKKVILLNPSYWERSNYTDPMVANYQQKLPQPGFVLQPVYKNTEATVDRFAGLSGYGIVHIYSHGLAWPDDDDIQEIYVKTGEVANLVTSAKYWKDILKGDVSAFLSKTGAGIKENVYFLSPNFIETYNDFSKDTVLFYGGFCYSFLGSWSRLYKKFADGCYFGFTWSVYTAKNAGWATSLIDSLADTLATEPYTSAKWWGGINPAKSYYDDDDKLMVYAVYAGDPSLTMWKENIVPGTFKFDGRTYNYRQIGTQTWMTENLAYLPAVNSAYYLASGYKSSYADPCYYVYNYSGIDVTAAKATSNYTTYGVLYNWAAANGACPPGWHLPSDDEWKVLEKYLGMTDAEANSTDTRTSGSIALKLKEKGTSHWDYNPGATNSSGFTALPGGHAWFYWGYDHLKYQAYFWSATETDSLNAWNRYLYDSYDGVHRYNQSKLAGYSVRCIKN
jgi:uncharacterized protein (TIGR02145 family)